ncbi:MAG: DUF429 domain-containing protein [Gluconacetobacter diazotrophicus]|nr:DUF429 domain-containing protein [Gluconacetobacter diazotrophicus]
MTGFRTLLHADWSAGAPGRWVARAERRDGGWRVSAPRPVGPLERFVDALFAAPAPVLAGFDLPIGLPERYGRATGLSGFTAALDEFGGAGWEEVFAVAREPGEVSVRRPFYPADARRAPRLRHLLEGLGVDTLDELRRRCEHATGRRRAANPAFWCMGANQVGKAAIVGWREVVAPARARGALLWPFDGDLAALERGSRPVLAETYPAEAYGHAGLRFPPGSSKRRAADRRAAMRELPAWLAERGIVPDGEAAAAIADGFDGHRRGDDAFDALAGLLGMIEVASGRRPAGPDRDADLLPWEGWILGQAKAGMAGTGGGGGA